MSRSICKAIGKGDVSYFCLSAGSCAPSLYCQLFARKTASIFRDRRLAFWFMLSPSPSCTRRLFRSERYEEHRIRKRGVDTEGSRQRLLSVVCGFGFGFGFSGVLLFNVGTFNAFVIVLLVTIRIECSIGSARLRHRLNWGLDMLASSCVIVRRGLAAHTKSEGVSCHC